MATISLIMIVKNEEKILERAVESVRSICDEIIICDTGSTDKTVEIIKKYAEPKFLTFTNYVETKNEALKLATSDFILFMDADEQIIEGLQYLKEWADTSNTNCINGFIVEGLNDGVPSHTYIRARLFKNNNNWHYEGPGVHEVLQPTTDSSTVTDHRIKILHSHDHKSSQDYSDKFRGYVEILKNYLKEHPNDGRATFYLGRTYKDLGNWLEAIEYYRKYLALNTNFRDEKWQAAYDMAVIWRLLGEYDQVFKVCDLAQEIDPRRAEIPVLLGEVYYGLQEWDKSIKYFEKAMFLPVPEDVVLFLNPRAHFEIPGDFLVLLYDRMRDYRRAYSVVKLLADKLSKPDNRLVHNITWLNKMQYKNIFFCLGNTPEPVYGGMIDKTGVGGIETSYIELSKEFAKLKHNCFLFCNCEKEEVYEGVYYIPFSKMGEYANLNPEVIITSRDYASLYRFANAKKIISAQDNLYTDSNYSNAFKDTDALVCSSQWHRYHLAHLLGEGLKASKINIIPLSIRGELYKDKNIVREPYKIIFSSNPNRGLKTLISYWDELCEKVPEINASIVYGFNGLRTWGTDPNWIESVNKEEQETIDWAKKAGNVQFLGRLKKEDLAKEQLSCSLCLYPTGFFETFGLTYLEMQAAGVVTVTTRLGALNTTLFHESNILIDDNPSGERYRKTFIDSVVELLQNNEKREKMSKQCIEYFNSQPTWESVAKKWENLIYGL